MTKVGIDVSNALDSRPTGVAKYILQLTAALERHCPEIKLQCYQRRSRPKPTDPSQNPSRNPIKRSWLYHTPANCQVFHAPDLRLPHSLRCPTVVTIHDLSALDRVDHATAKFLAKKQAQIQRAVQQASVIICHTQTVADDLRARFPERQSPIIPVPLATELLPILNRALTEQAQSLLVVGGPSRRKRSDRLVELLRCWHLKLNWRPQIRWVGSGESDDAIQLIQKCDEINRSQIHWLGHVSDRELLAEYDHCDGLLQLSTTEGFAIPLLEAAQRSCPILSFAAPVLQEVIGHDGACWITEEHSTQQIAAAQRFQSLAHRCALVRAAQQNSLRYSWLRSAKQMASIYASLVEE